MSTSSSSSLHPTRRQLDELDALMERMLKLPVDSTADGTNQATLEPESVSDSSANGFAGFTASGFASYTTDDSDSLPVGSSSAFDFSSATESPTSPTDERDGASPFTFQSTGSRSTTAGANTGASFMPSADAGIDDAPSPVWLWPVAGINKFYDSVVGGFGRPGRLFLGTGRVWLGWIGLLMLAAALAWGVLDWIHWAG